MPIYNPPSSSNGSIVIDTTPIVGGNDNSILFQQSGKVSEIVDFNFNPGGILNVFTWQVDTLNYTNPTLRSGTGNIGIGSADNPDNLIFNSQSGVNSFISGFDGDSTYFNAFGGNVGINKSSADYQLDVNGDINTSGNYLINGVPIPISPWLTQDVGPLAIYYLAGDVGIGTDSPTTFNGGVTKELEIFATGGNSLLVLGTDSTDVQTGGVLEVIGGRSGRIGQWNVRYEKNDSSKDGEMLFEVNSGADVQGIWRGSSNGGTAMGHTYASASFATLPPPANGLQVQGKVGIGFGTTVTAFLHLLAGSTAATTAPLKFTSGSLMTTAEAGAVEFLTDKFYGTITTSAARKEFTLNDAALTSGRVPIVTTNGRLTDDSDMTFATDTLTVTGLKVGTTKVTSFNGVTTSGLGVPAIYATGRSTAQTAAVASVSTYTVGAADGSFEISANVLITTSTLHNFTATVAYTDEGNTARTVTLQFSTLAGAFVTAMTNAQGAVPYEGVALHIRAKASTAITIATTGTFTTVTYNVEGIIRQLA